MSCNCEFKKADSDSKRKKGDEELSVTILEERLQIARKEMAVTMRGFYPLTEDEKLVLRIFYSGRVKYPVKLLCKRLRYSPRSIYRIKNRALEKFTLACYGKSGIEETEKNKCEE